VVHEEEPAVEKVPAKHVEQVTVPVVPVYFPAAQLVQTDAPAAEYVPIGQGVQVTVAVVAV
jgi:hypothetical protein